MKKKAKRSFICIMLVFSYALGSVLFPVTANPNFDELLSQRKNNKTVDTPVTPALKTEISDFTDIHNDAWYYSYVKYLVENSIIKGKTPTSFSPDSSFSYAECCTVIARYLGLEDECLKQTEIMKNSNIPGGSEWYAGYVSVIQKLGIFSDTGLFEETQELLSAINTDIAQSPVERCDFAVGISKSFEISGNIRAKNVYSEIGGRGREFIAGGAYNQSILEEYATYISDYDEIPEDARLYVLKAYYNGIFNGDTHGRFNPYDNLTRAEMAKVLATILDYSQRKPLIDTGYAVPASEDMFFYDAFGNKTLSYEASLEILQKEAEFLNVQNGFVDYCVGFNAPFGYAIDVYLYTLNDDGIYEKVEECSLHDFSEGVLTYNTVCDARVLMVLRNTAENARQEGVLDIRIENGNITSTSPIARTM